MRNERERSFEDRKREYDESIKRWRDYLLQTGELSPDGALLETTEPLTDEHKADIMALQKKDFGSEAGAAASAAVEKNWDDMSEEERLAAADAMPSSETRQDEYLEQLRHRLVASRVLDERGLGYQRGDKIPDDLKGIMAKLTPEDRQAIAQAQQAEYRAQKAA